MTQGRVMPTVSHSWNASWPIAAVGTWPVMTTIGIESMYAVAMPVTALVTPGPRRHQRDADLLRRARIAVGRVDRALLVADQHVLDARLLEQLVVDVEDRAARVAEDVVDAFFLQTADQDFRTRQFHDVHASSVCPSRRRGERSCKHAGRTRVERAPAKARSGRKPRMGQSGRLQGGSLTLVASRRERSTALVAIQHPGLAARNPDITGKCGRRSRRGLLRRSIERPRRGNVDPCAYNRRAHRRDRSNWLTIRKFRAFSPTSSVAPSSRRCIAVRDEDAALDIVQDAMLKLTENYSDKPAGELPMLFQRILQNAIHDHFRRQKVRSTWTTLLSALGHRDDKDDDYDPLETLQAKTDSNAPADPAAHAEQRQIDADRSSRRSRGCRRVNARRSCCVTGRNSTSRRRPPPWAARRAASRRTARARSMPWPRC